MNVAVIGLGLIGGSLLRALAAHGHHVAGYDLGRHTREAARGLAKAAEVPVAADPQARTIAIKGKWRVAESIAEAVEGAELVVLAVPLPAIPGVLAELAGHPGLITDVTSVKGPVRDLLRGRRFVGGHPMAGKETSGFAASDPYLFDDCAWVLCLESDGTDLADWLALAGLCTGLGARVVPVTAAEHDRAVAGISHVPHLLAAALSTVLADNPLAGTLAAGSFRDGTRVAGTRPELIAAMCGGNAPAARQVLAGIVEELESYGRDLAADDPITVLTERLRAPSDLRRAWPPQPGEAVEVSAEPGALLALGRAGGWVTAVRDGKIEAMRPGSDRNSS
ncbi:prephenate dehydrogenase/arogenate dehydrogenase family protein [Actinoplanes sp. ATCC 53533]|uniref:prephenate dehydrogenase n=1 Tax=Actinoplanes sp. ATCC 53533 TaxID=1288362 RepID=UPI000F7AA9A2|nr:prephenate dehydrogenase/arogenate dehydrogenase family protein [Actinoplanes sp. ATCC 53533]RSM72784.1 prephenate dehydrogenase/arogenate dehydrogenase family protein [Actinoplanes sp. ATCC 53533]